MCTNSVSECFPICAAKLTIEPIDRSFRSLWIFVSNQGFTLTREEGTHSHHILGSHTPHTGQPHTTYLEFSAFIVIQIDCGPIGLAVHL